MELEYFQLVGRIDSLNPAEGRIETRSVVPDKSTIFEGHFPGMPILPGVLLVENMAQSCGFLLLALEKFERLPFLIQVVSAKLRTFVSPGNELHTTGILVHQGSGYAVANSEIRRDGKAIASAELRFRIMPFPTETLKQQVRTRAEAIGFAMAAE